MVVTTEDARQIKAQGYADIGGLKKTRYWTPDGREILAVSAMRTYNIVKDGKVTGSGVRDANLDSWLSEKPANPKPHCPHCDKWHDTQKEIVSCGNKKKAFQDRQDKLSQKMQPAKEDLRAKVDSLESDISDIKSLLTKLLARRR